MEQPKHVCKFCSKSFPSGRSLGGHMRSHISAATSPPTTAAENSAPATTTASASGYGLREKRKKPWRLAISDSIDHVITHNTHNTHAATTKDSNSIKRRFCKECGKGFPSWKALFGHMKCHSNKQSQKRPSSNVLVSYSQDRDSWTTTQSDNINNNNHSLKPTQGPRSKRVRRSSSLSFSSVDEIDERDLDEVAWCLILLSMGSPRRSSPSKSKKLRDLDDSVADDDDVKGKRNLNKFECVTCNKVFPSYQSLGGHRASHKKIAKDCFVPMVDESSEDNCVKADADSDLPALVEEPVENKRILIDLNLPPADDVEQEEEDCKNNNSNSECYRASQLPCRVTSIPNKQELLVGLISNY